MQPLYFLPNLQRNQLAPGGNLSRAILQERGIADAFADVVGISVDCYVGEVVGGPGGHSGVILCYQTPEGKLPDDCGYYPDDQEWTPIGDGTELWIGIDPKDPPQPEDLQRKRTYAGYHCPLKDDRTWIVPVIRRPDDSTLLPTDMLLDDDGTVRKPIVAAYEQIWQDTEEACRWVFDGEEADEGTALALAIRILGVNYRFGRHEHNTLKVIDSASLFSLMASAVDAPKVMQELGQKKTN